MVDRLDVDRILEQFEHRYPINEGQFFCKKKLIDWLSEQKNLYEEYIQNDEQKKKNYHNGKQNEKSLQKWI